MTYARVNQKNIFAENQHYSYVAKGAEFKCPLSNKRAYKNNRADKKIKKPVFETLYWMIIAAFEQKDSSKFKVPNNYIKTSVCCSDRMVSYYFRKLEEAGYISRTPVAQSDGNFCFTTNYFEILWPKIHEDFGKDFLFDLLGIKEINHV